MNEENNSSPTCLYYSNPKEIVWVHGHGQCAHYGINTDECCRGESCENKT